MIKKLNKKSKIILILGKSGSGKNWFVNEKKLKPVISYTTRNIRKDETNGVEHYFVSTDDYQETLKNNIVAETFFNGNYYWATDKCLVNKNAYIIDLNGLKQFKENMGKDFYISIFIECPFWKRVYRMMKRGDGFINIIKRFLHDVKAFRGYKNFIDKYIKN